MEPPPAAPFTRRTATVLLVGAVVTFVVGMIALALGWLEVATACAAMFAVGWLGLRSRIKRLKREEREAEEAEVAARAEERREAIGRDGTTVRSRHSERRRPRS